MFRCSGMRYCTIEKKSLLQENTANPNTILLAEGWGWEIHSYIIPLVCWDHFWNWVMAEELWRSRCFDQGTGVGLRVSRQNWDGIRWRWGSQTRMEVVSVTLMAANILSLHLSFLERKKMFWDRFLRAHFPNACLVMVEMEWMNVTWLIYAKYRIVRNSAFFHNALEHGNKMANFLK